MLRKNVGLFLILFFAFILRIWGIRFGLPGLFHTDERFFPYNAFYALTHQFQIVTIWYGSFLPYLLGGLYGIYYSLLLLVGEIHTPMEFLTMYYKDPSTFYLIGRFTMVVFSTLSVWMVYLIAKKLFNLQTAFISSVFLAVSFLYIKESQIMKGDIPATCLMLVSLYFIIKSSDAPSWRTIVLGGIFCGLAIGVRYYLISFFIVPVLLYLLNPNKGVPLVYNPQRKWKFILIFVATTFITFLLTTPIFIFQFREFMSNILELIQIETGGPWISPQGYPVWLYFLVVHFRKGLGTAFIFLAIIGGIYLLLKRNLKLFVTLLSFPLIYFIILNNTTNFARYGIPLVPFFAILAASFLDNIVMRIKVSYSLRYCLMCVLVFATIYPSLLNIIRYNYLICHVDTRIVAKEWIEKNIPSGAKIVNEGGTDYEEISMVGVPLHKEDAILRKCFGSAINKGTSGKSCRAMMDANKTRKVLYDLENLHSVDKWGTLTSVGEYVDCEVEYIIMISWMTTWPLRKLPLSPEFKESLLKHYELIKVFFPNPLFRWDMYGFQLDCEALKKVSIFERNLHPGPIVEIYKKKCS